jgi:microcystin-dependent protein
MGIQINGQTDNISAADGSLSVDGTLNITGNITGDGTVPPGTLIFHCGNTAPSGFLKANGATISRSTYADLFATLGTTFGTGDGSTTFTLPDMRGEFPRGWDDGRGIDPARVFGAAQSSGIARLIGEIRSLHGSAAMETDLVSGFTNPFVGQSSTSWRHTIEAVTSNFARIRFDSARVIADSSPDGARPRNIALLACIKY